MRFIDPREPDAPSAMTFGLLVHFDAVDVVVFLAHPAATRLSAARTAMSASGLLFI
jgi:hypothetical protein